MPLKKMIYMSESFAKKWAPEKEEKSFSETLRETVRPAQPLKPKIDSAIKALDMQTAKLNQTNERLVQKDKVLFTKLVDAYAKHDQSHANMYASELVEVRKMTKIILNSRLALDQVSLRIRSISELGDVVATFGSCIGVIRSVSQGLVGVLPEAEGELGSIGNLLSGLMTEAGGSSEMSINFNQVNGDADKILAEASAVAEQRLSMNFPDLPKGLSVGALSKK